MDKSKPPLPDEVLSPTEVVGRCIFAFGLFAINAGILYDPWLIPSLYILYTGGALAIVPPVARRIRGYWRNRR